MIHVYLKDFFEKNYFEKKINKSADDIKNVKNYPVGKDIKPVLSGHSKIDKTKVLMTNGSLMKVESIAECPPPPTWSILQYFWPA